MMNYGAGVIAGGFSTCIVPAVILIIIIIAMIIIVTDHLN